MSRDSRRRFLSGIAGSVTVVTAGCSSILGDDDDSGSDDPSQNQQPQSNQQPQQQNTPEPQPTETPVPRIDRETLYLDYVSGYNSGQDGISRRNAAVSAFNDENYAIAERAAGDAVDQFDSANRQLQDALDAAYEIGNDEAIDICSTAVEWSSLHSDANQNLEAAADLAQSGRTDTANNRVDRSRDSEREAERLSLINPTVLESVLDIN